jgi:hypothetical protein
MMTLQNSNVISLAPSACWLCYGNKNPNKDNMILDLYHEKENQNLTEGVLLYISNSQMSWATQQVAGQLGLPSKTLSP